MTETIYLKTGVTCPECGGEGFTEGAVEDHGDRTQLCETCWGEGAVPARWMEMYAKGSSGLCDLCFQPRGAAWNGMEFLCVECWEGGCKDENLKSATYEPDALDLLQRFAKGI